MRVSAECRIQEGQLCLFSVFNNVPLSIFLLHFWPAPLYAADEKGGSLGSSTFLDSSLTLKASITTAAGDIHKSFSLFF